MATPKILHIDWWRIAYYLNVKGSDQNLKKISNLCYKQEIAKITEPYPFTCLSSVVCIRINTVLEANDRSRYFHDSSGTGTRLFCNNSLKVPIVSYHKNFVCTIGMEIDSESIVKTLLHFQRRSFVGRQWINNAGQPMTTVVIPEMDSRSVDSCIKQINPHAQISI